MTDLSPVETCYPSGFSIVEYPDRRCWYVRQVHPTSSWLCVDGTVVKSPFLGESEFNSQQEAEETLALHLLKLGANP